ncbi:hypothetical protein BU25DRAFT_482296 [Macroventuria anomochaeta]|uniref:Uncharacterized protein n=1 Tax=Macroventuria anomochaeta TaxID=301207 RepID=A0ACB6RIQ0_9PLEO|nr:uncharacterized protein BU25DRAFT_482296 [Macroventuria anomochaeta]KAF2621815.1 hypothetical protein BU25DRAFT_482296 [Macroventuria anomochaeta]
MNRSSLGKIEAGARGMLVSMASCFAHGVGSGRSQAGRHEFGNYLPVSTGLCHLVSAMLWKPDSSCTSTTPLVIEGISGSLPFVVGIWFDLIEFCKPLQHSLLFANMLVAVGMLVQLPFRSVVPQADDISCQILIGLFCVVVVILRRCISDTSNLQLNNFDSNPGLWFALHVLAAHKEVRCAPVGLLVMTNISKAGSSKGMIGDK